MYKMVRKQLRMAHQKFNKPLKLLILDVSLGSIKFN